MQRSLNPKQLIPRKKKRAQVDSALVKQELETIRKYLKGGEGWLALFFCENTMGLNMLAKADLQLSEQIMSLHANCEKKTKSTGRPCPTCDGKGTVVKTLDTVSSKGETLKQQLPSVTCSTCNGSGRVAGRGNLNQIRYQHGKAMKRLFHFTTGTAMDPGRQSLGSRDA